MEVNLPGVVAEVQEAFARYERALTTNDLAGMDSCFWTSGHTIRFGIAENLYGIEAIRAFRAGRSPAGLARDLSRTVITTFGRDFATASTLFTRTTVPSRIGRQQQSWARLPEGWRIVAAHVSLIPDG